jgi:hypothetical protein
VLTPTALAEARDWGSMYFRLAEEGMTASPHVEGQLGTTVHYRRFRDGELLTDEEVFTVARDMLDDTPVLRVDVETYDDEASALVHHTIYLDELTLQPLMTRHRKRGAPAWTETVYEREEALVSSGSSSRTLRTAEDTVAYLTLPLMFLKFLDSEDRMKFSFLSDEVLYHFSAALKDPETIVLPSGTYQTFHVACPMRGTWAHLAPKLHYWIETTPPHRLVKYQVKHEVVELVE